MKVPVDEETARMIMGANFIGTKELNAIESVKLDVGDNVPDIPYSSEELTQKKNDYILILGVSRFQDGSFVNIRNLQEIFGNDPKVKEPCFYNQDWYNNETFIDVPMEDKWYIIRKHVFEDSRAVHPSQLSEKYDFPLAIKCVYSFFIAWLALDVKLWYHDFVWCSDVDHNGDRIYVGKYHDVDGVNKNGFSIHRHLVLRSCYACID